MSNTVFNISKLRGADDFPVWKRRIIALLQEKDYDVCIGYNATNFDPLESQPDFTSTNVSSRIDLKARGLIELSVDDSILSQLISESTAHAYWVKLHQIYQRKSLSSVVFKLRNLVTCMQDGRPAQEYIGQVESRARDLQSAGIMIPDQLISALVVCNLDSRFHTVATALDAHELDQLSLVKITSLLLNEEARQDQDQAAPHANLAGQKRRCKVHPHLGHTDEQCYTQHPELRPNKWKPRSNTDHAQPFHYASEASTSKSRSKSRVWHVDTGCSNHMTFDRGSLSQFHSGTSNPLVQLGDNTSIPSIGFGTSKVNIQGVSIPLDRVLAVPDLGKNLFSPGQASESGMKFLIDGDHMTIFQRDGFTAPTGKILVKIRKDRDNLYRLDSDSTQSPSHRASFAIRHDIPLPISLWHAS